MDNRCRNLVRDTSILLTILNAQDIRCKQFKFKMDILGVNNTLLSWNLTELQIIHETATDVKLWKQKFHCSMPLSDICPLIPTGMNIVFQLALEAE